MTDKASNSEWLDAELFSPFQKEQALLYEHAEWVAARAFLKMVNLPFGLEQRPNAEFMSPDGSVPFLKLQKTLVFGYLNIVEFVSQKGIKLTNTLSEADIADMNALMALIRENLLNAEKYFCWSESSNYHSVTKRRYGSVYPVPLKWWLPYLKRKDIVSQLNDSGFANKTIDDVVKKAETVFHALSVKLGNQRYFMGDEPTELDALAFGHIFSILTIELPSNHLATALRKHANLMNFCIAIDEELFKLD
ncbi:unnamed protein product [Bursaphelenchus xylophilus]|uniref:(pine wood nematode) hypothetical protein n=1 Tax=Bursaphelenchus xylophilus TaxID=6326 RepID=A0A1I7SQK2_BURXY|nr:unnamed protein product [Bursaphelenchus xylophilus]CAG9110020.1 unnamed protein product [Bursaphelenchus xylophilus]